ncbi:MAG TPA: GNAT family N-acetyltransferase [Acetobacteraceae bacterium]|nr:GNAT family N-acetyltransferase [Acetobacteraceae bacterium]
MIAIRRARPADAIAIAAVHVAAWRSAYPGILPDGYLANLSVSRQAAYYDAAIRGTTGVFVATASGPDVPSGPDPGSSPGAAARFTGGPRIIGFGTAGRARPAGEIGGRRLGEGEIETLYVLDDWRERGIGRRLMRASAAHLAETGCRSVFLWVLRDNPSRWFYQRLGGKPVAEAAIQFAGRQVVQTAFVWDPIERLLAASPQEL